MSDGVGVANEREGASPSANGGAAAFLYPVAETLRLALDAGDLGTWEWNPATDALTLSPRAAGIYGVDPGRPHPREAMRALLHPDHRDRSRVASARAAADRADYDIEYPLVSGRWVSARGRGVYGPDGGLVRMIGVVQDVTARKEAEAALRASEGRYRAIVEATPECVKVVGPDGTLLQMNRAGLAMVEGDESAIGCCVYGVIAPEDRDRFRVLNEQVCRGEGGGLEYDVVGLKGTRRHMETAAVPLPAGRGGFHQLAVTRDVTARKQAEREVARVTAESDRRTRLYETVLSSTPDFVYVFSLDHRVLYANDALIAMWGRGRDGAIGKTFLEIGYEPWHAEMHGREIDQVRATRRPIRGEVPFDGTHGRRIYDYIFVPVLGADGEVEAVAGTTRDVTDRKGMEDALRESDRKKDEFIALLAHELRNPLAPIRNGLQVIRLADDRPTRDKSLRMMDRQLSHMVRMIDDLLDVSRIGRNKMDLRRGRVTLADVIASAVETARPAVDDAGHELTVTLPPLPLVLDADLTRLSQVFSNLLTNSARYTPRGGRIWLAAEPAGGDVVVAVRDTGIGIPSDALPTIFDMFSQVDRSVERSTGGLGIGLALVKGLVEMHGGTVAARSDGEGLGSTFTVTLPTRAGADQGAVEPTASAAPRPAGRRVLVVDDNRDGADSLAMMLELIGYRVELAHDGVEAVERAERFRPEVILMDVGMPRLNGLDATRRIREHDWGRAVTIIALTGWGQEHDRERSRAAGCDGHLVKPVELSDLERLLAELGRAG